MPDSRLSTAVDTSARSSPGLQGKITKQKTIKDSLQGTNEDLKKAVELLGRSSLAREKDSLLHELQVLQAENSKLKDMLRDAEATPLRRHPAPPPATDKDDNLATLTREFLQELASLDTKERQNVGSSGTSNTLSGTSNTLSGTSNALSGTSNTLSGTSNTLSGTSNTLSGTSNTLSKVGSAGAVTITSTADV
ncbi:hypothetical protein C0Q70_13055 [Pomacea canaliculata]|uniref:Uncharacterized protein n=1 Tax=Pomacea canaliculata TaxID=400727 RepID=A0A2T7NW50_POMCA|nr:hypothetical protein C0Q70_13055 [Pomacea canaliculata]